MQRPRDRKIFGTLEEQQRLVQVEPHTEGSGGWRPTRRDQRGELAPDQEWPYDQARSEEFILNKIQCPRASQRHAVIWLTF